MEKVKAHAELWHIQAGLVEWKHFVGNELADAFAKKGARPHQVSDYVSEDIDNIDRLAWQIPERIIAANIAALEFKEANRSKDEFEEEYQ